MYHIFPSDVRPKEKRRVDKKTEWIEMFETWMDSMKSINLDLLIPPPLDEFT